MVKEIISTLGAEELSPGTVSNIAKEKESRLSGSDVRNEVTIPRDIATDFERPYRTTA